VVGVSDAPPGCSDSPLVGGGGSVGPVVGGSVVGGAVVVDPGSRIEVEVVVLLVPVVLDELPGVLVPGPGAVCSGVVIAGGGGSGGTAGGPTPVPPTAATGRLAPA
jgi:hypothetical protein